MQIKIRKTKKNEIKLLRKIAKATPEVLDTQNYIEGEITFERLLKHGICIVAELDKEIVGFLLANLNERTHCSYLIYCITKPKYRGKGIGTMLMKEWFRICRKNKVTYLDTYAPSFNKKTVTFYQKMGMTKGKPWIYFSKKLKH